jgi:hypothetical protein
LKLAGIFLPAAGVAGPARGGLAGLRSSGDLEFPDASGGRAGGDWRAPELGKELGTPDFPTSGRLLQHRLGSPAIFGPAEEGG